METSNGRSGSAPPLGHATEGDTHRRPAAALRAASGVQAIICGPAALALIGYRPSELLDPGKATLGDELLTAVAVPPLILCVLALALCVRPTRTLAWTAGTGNAALGLLAGAIFVLGGAGIAPLMAIAFAVFAWPAAAQIAWACRGGSGRS